MRAMRAIILWAAVMVLGCAGVAAWAAGPDDGVPVGRVIESRYFTVSLAPGVEEWSLVRSLDIAPGHKIIVGPSPSYSPNSLGDLLDALFAWSGGVLDMNLYSYKGRIKVVRTTAELGEVYRRLYGVADHAEKGFYVFSLNTLFVAQEDFTKEIVGHEIAHAIISNFFVVQPPEKVQEVLAGYIEFQLRKITPDK